ncbi:MAG: methylmalonyl Co-A mutase-associated GTPase MeaB [Gemmatimonadales bacterium]|jgi:LAO/AO transport system kinase|nr:methylmalonyl Co-A mutase-associated GTPase MeaB [Gemmatimonadota bacterium]MBP6444659.1 methylmalonyl Co-A mutase-associated GTPase MeaB [Gemmatimonadales bacterium]MBP6570389.1 methylmalonyl Co-A mutase-associated GTPase MeaB [Gemmatimonadales bacterium]MBP7620722.1 methylmalonyl Co-A mutase-associated GTPase MeaB [Gemmatimonadales bacterium]MBP9899229.1 methylmalonyl Co-A mutase-associated GTPase MeaB [Gemmatimonadales bacterium]
MSETTLAAQVLDGKVAGVARAVSVVENARTGFEDLLSTLHPHLGHARRIGLTGPPGAGKSTLTERLTQAYRAQGLRVAVVAVDPTSPFTGGALLGDRIRMESVALDPGVFIRSMATRGSLGGLATSTREVCDVLDAAGFDRILVETVGVGQSELDVTRMADTSLLALVPESGDGIQALKSGVMEAADLFVINKSDRPGAPKLQREVEMALDLRAGKTLRNIPAHHGALRGPKGPVIPEDDSGWRPPVLLTIAAQGEGIPELVDALERHWQWLTESGGLASRRRDRLAQRTREVVDRAARRWVWQESHAEEAIAARLDEIGAGAMSPYELAAEIVAALREGARV